MTRPDNDAGSRLTRRALIAGAGGAALAAPLLAQELGQMIDLAVEHVATGIGEITRLQRLKTGALIQFACEAGALAARAPAPFHDALRFYAQDFGLAFQMIDDLLDVEGSAAAMGKAVGKDAARGKATFVSLLGVDRARDQAHRLADQAAAHLAPFGRRAGRLRDLAAWVVKRTS